MELGAGDLILGCFPYYFRTALGVGVAEVGRASEGDPVQDHGTEREDQTPPSPLKLRRRLINKQ